MIQTLRIADLKCDVAAGKPSSPALYMIYPAIVPLPESWLEDVAQQYGVSVAAVYVPADEWNNYLTPWAEPGETPQSPPFGGKAMEFKKLLESRVIPEVEKSIGCTGAPERYLLGVSLSGLFTLWDWMQSDLFGSIACLSGSFWYEGFMDWFDSMPVPGNKGKAFFLLGVKEPKARIKAFRSVGENTLKIVGRLKESGVSVEFKWVPGDHLSGPLGRAEIGIKAAFNKNC